MHIRLLNRSSRSFTTSSIDARHTYSLQPCTSIHNLIVIFEKASQTECHTAPGQSSKMLLFHLLNKRSKASKADKAPTPSTKSSNRASPTLVRMELLALAQLQHYHRLKRIEKRLKKIQEALLEDDGGEDDELEESAEDPWSKGWGI